MPDTILDTEDSMTDTRVSAFRSARFYGRDIEQTLGDCPHFTNEQRPWNCRGSCGRVESSKEASWLPVFSEGTFTRQI